MGVPAVSLEANNGSPLSNGVCGNHGGDSLAASHDRHPIADTNLRAQGAKESLFIILNIFKMVGDQEVW